MTVELKNKNVLLSHLICNPNEIANSFLRINDDVTDKAFEISLQRSFDDLNRNYLALKLNDEVSCKLTSIIRKIFEFDKESNLFLRDVKLDVLQQLLRIFDAAEELKPAAELLRLVAFLKYFWHATFWTNVHSTDDRLIELEKPAGVLETIKNALQLDGDLYAPLHHMLSERLAYPKVCNEPLRLFALDLLYFGIQTYFIAICFINEQYAFLADYYFQKGDTPKCNKCFELLLKIFNDTKPALMGDSKKTGLMQKTIQTFEELQCVEIDKLNIRLCNLRKTETMMNEAELPIELDKPDAIERKPDFSKSQIQTPMGVWENKTKVSYAVQYKSLDGIYSQIGEWSPPYTVGSKSSPELRIPRDSKQRIRLILRKLGAESPQLVGIFYDGDLKKFRCIDRDLHNAVANYDEDQAILDIKKLLTEGADIDTAFENNRKPIHAAAAAGNTHLATEYLFNKGYNNVDAKDDEDYTPMHIAAEFDYEDFVERLLTTGADVNAVTYFGLLTPLHIAAFKGNEDVIKVLLANDKINVNQADEQGFTALHYGVFGGLSVIKALLTGERPKKNQSTNFLDVNAESVEGLTALHVAVINQSYNVVEFLLGHEGIADTLTSHLFQALHFAIMKRDLRMLKLIRNSCTWNVNVPTVNALTALHWAIALNDDILATELLKDKHIDVNVKAYGLVTPLHLAAKNERHHLANLLIHRGADINAQTEAGLSATHIAAKFGCLSTLKVLVELGANIDLKTLDGSTPLSIAAASKHSNTAVVEYLIGKVAPNEKPQNFKWLAAKTGNVEIMNFIWKHFDGHKLRDETGNSLLHIAVKSDNLEVIEFILKENDLHLKRRNNVGQTPLLLAAAHSSLESFKFLLENGSKLDDQANNGATVLHFAAQAGNLEVVRFINNEKGMDAFVSDNTGQIPVIYAAQAGQLHVVKYFMDDENCLNYCIDMLFAATYANQLNVLHYLIDELGVPANCYDPNQRTPLHYAAQAACGINIFEFLLNESSNINANDNQGRTPLMFAVQNATLDVVEYLVENGANVDVEDNDERTLLHYAACNKDIEVWKFLSTNKVLTGVSGEDAYGETPLFHAARACNFEVVKYLVEQALLDVHQVNNDNFTPIFSAALSGSLSIVQYLATNYHAAVNIKNKKNYTTLHAAVESKNLELVEFLAANLTINIDACDDAGRTPLLLAAKTSSLDILKHLIAKGADTTARDKIGFNILHLATIGDNLEIVRYLIEEGFNADPFIKDNKSENIIFYAARAGSIAVLKYLIDGRKAKFNDTNIGRETPLFVAVAAGKMAVVEYLLQQRGVDVNVFTRRAAATPLHMAVSCNYTKIAQLLLKSSANIHEENSDGKTPILWAAQCASYELFQILIQAGADIRDMDVYERTTLHYAAFSGNLDKIKFLIEENHMRPNIRDAYGETPLFCAAVDGKREAVEYLVEVAKASIHQKSNCGATPLFSAVLKGNLDVVEYFIEELGANVNDANNNGVTLLDVAVEAANFELVRFLVAHGAELNTKQKHKEHTADFNETMQNLLLDALQYCMDEKSFAPDKKMKKENLRDTVLHKAAKSGDLKMLHFLVDDHNFQIDVKNDLGQTPLFCAAQAGNFEAVKFFVEIKKQDIAKISKSGATILHEAAVNGQLKIVKYLVEERGADVNTRTFNGQWPLHFAARGNSLDTFKFLWQCEEDIEDELKNYAITLLNQASAGGNLEIIRHLVEEKGFAVSTVNLLGENPVFIAAKFGKLEAVKYFLEQRKLDLSNWSKRPLLNCAASNGQVNVVRYLIEDRKEAVDSRDFRGLTPLLSAVSSNCLDTIKCLLEHGGNINAKDSNLRTVLHLAAENGNTEIIQYFVEEHDVDVNAEDIIGLTPAFLAAVHGKLDAVKYFIEQQRFNVNSKTKHEKSLLHYAAEHGHASLVEYLVKQKADLGARDKNGSTPLLLGAAGKSLETIKTLLKFGAEITEVNYLVFNVLHFAASSSTRDILNFFIETFNLEPEVKTIDGLTPLYLAVKNGNLDAVKYLTELRPLSTDIKNSKPTTLLYCALRYKKFKVAEYLLQTHHVDINAKFEDNQSLLHFLAVDGTLDAVKFALKFGADINFQDNFKRSIMHFAAHGGKLETIKYLVDEQKLDITAKDIDGDTPLFQAAYAGSIETLKYFLVEKELSVHSRNNKGQTILHIAALKGNLEVIRYLVEDCGAAVSAESNESETATPLLCAIEGNHLEAIKYLLEHGTNMAADDISNGTVLNSAAWQGNLKIIKSFVEEKNYDINVKSKIQATPLFYAAKSGKFEVVKYFLGYSKSKNISIEETLKLRDQNERTVLHWAAEGNNLELLQHLLDCGADFAAIDKNGCTLLHSAAMAGNLDIIKHLVQVLNFDVNAENTGGETPAFYAAKSGRLEALKYFVEDMKVAVNSQNKRKKTMLFDAAHNGHIEVIDYLIDEQKADLKIVDDLQRTALFSAVAGKSVEAVKTLLKYGSDINETDSMENTLVHLAAGGGNLAIIEHLVNERKMDANAKNSAASTPVFFAAKSDKLEVVKWFIEKKNASVHALDSNKSTLLHEAALKGSLDIVCYLVKEKDANVNNRDNSGFTPLSCAISSKKLDIVRLLVESGADISDKENSIGNALHWAVTTGSLEIIDYLVDELNFDCNAKNKTGDPAIFMAAQKGQKGNLEAIRYFIDVKKCNPNITNDKEETLFIYAVQNDQLEVVKYFVEEKNINVNNTNKDMQTVLYDAVFRFSSKVLKYLLENTEIFINSKDVFGGTLLHYAKLIRNKNAQDLLKSHGAIDKEERKEGLSKLNQAIDKLKNAMETI